MKWLFLPGSEPDKLFIIGDFFIMFFAFCQLRVFQIEHEKSMQIDGGVNSEVIYSNAYNLAKNPRRDFMIRVSTVLDIILAGTFSYGFWICVAMVYLAATSRVSVFSAFYLLMFIVYLWLGNELFVKDVKYIVAWWNFFLGGNVFVIAMKTALQLPSCAYQEYLREHGWCLLAQVLGSTCLHSGIVSKVVDDVDAPKTCELDPDMAGLAWDATVCVVLLFQRRAFMSWYFQHVAIEHVLQGKLASRGANIIRDHVKKRVQRKKLAEERNLKSIKERIEKRQKESQVKEKWVDPPDHYVATRSGDYWMFEENDDIDDIGDEDSDFSDDEEKKRKQEAERSEQKEPGPLEIFHRAVQGGNINETVRELQSPTSEFARQHSVFSRLARQDEVSQSPLSPTSR